MFQFLTDWPLVKRLSKVEITIKLAAKLLLMN